MTNATKTQMRVYEMLTENTGKHMLDSGMADGRHWQQNQKHDLSEWLNRPSAILEIEYGTYPVLDIFGFLTNRLRLTEKAEQFQDAFIQWVAEDSERSPYSCNDMEEWAEQFHDGGETSVRIANSYNWENYLSQVIQYVDFEFLGASFTLLQIHGGADVRGGYSFPQVFETNSTYWSYDMQDAIIQCTGEGCECPDGAKPCEFYIDIRGMSDIFDKDGCNSMTSEELSDLKKCPECGGELEALAPEPGGY